MVPCRRLLSDAGKVTAARSSVQSGISARLRTRLASGRAKVLTGFGTIMMDQPKTAKSEAPQPEKALIYVVDDEPMLLELATVVLEPIGYQIRTFRDPDTAVRAFAAEPRHPALVITDYAMHTLNGLELIAACRRLQPRQKVLLLSGTVDEQIYDDLPAKPDRFLAKPYQAKQLIEAVRALLAD